MPILVLTFLLSKKVSRHPTIVNFCVTWILYSISYCLLIYGGYNKNVHPPQSLCLIQSALLYGAPTMAVVATLVLVMEIWSAFYPACEPAFFASLPHGMRLFITLSLPYLILLIFTLAAAYVAASNPEKVDAANGLTCSIHVDHFERFTTSIFCTVVLLTVTAFEVAIAVKCYRGWREIKDVCPDAAVRKPSLSPCFRATVFLVYSWIAFGACIIVMTSPENRDRFSFMAQAALPLTAFIVFSTQKDVAGVWTSPILTRVERYSCLLMLKERSMRSSTRLKCGTNATLRKSSAAVLAVDGPGNKIATLA